MFDVSFGELLVIAIVALVVIGPEKLPKVARTLGLLAGRMQRYVTAVRADIERELQTQELGKIQSELQQAVTTVEASVKSVGADVQSVAAEVQTEAQQIAAPVTEAAHTVEQASRADPPPGAP